jgi:hypothetical protein
MLQLLYSQGYSFVCTVDKGLVNLNAHLGILEERKSVFRIEPWLCSPNLVTFEREIASE